MSLPVEPSFSSEPVSWCDSLERNDDLIFTFTVDCYRNKTRSAMESIMQDVKTSAPHYETRVGKRKWNERMRVGEKRDDE